MTESSNNSPQGFKSLRLVLLGVIPIVVLAIAIIMYWQSGRFVETDNAYIKADVVPISAEVSAAIVSVFAKENQTVEKGQVLFELRADPFRLTVNETKAKLAEVRATILAQKASYREMQAQIKLANTEYEFAKKELQRQRDLKGKNFVSESTLDDLEHNVEVSNQRLQVLALELEKIAAYLNGDVNSPLNEHPAYQSAEAQVNLAELALSRTKVRAPVTGIVSQLPTIGQYVHTGTTVAALVSTEDLWVEANFPETDLTHVRVGQTVAVHIDTYPDVDWIGVVDSISPATGAEFSILPPQNATGNWVKIAQRVPVRINLNTPSDAPVLRVGLSAIVEIDTEFRRQLFTSSHSSVSPASLEKSVLVNAVDD